MQVEINGRLYTLEELNGIEVAMVRGKKVTMATLYKKWKKKSDVPFSLFVENYCRDARCLNPIGNMAEPPKIVTFEECVRDVMNAEAYDLETRVPGSVLERLVCMMATKACEGNVKAADALYKWSGEEKIKVEGNLDLNAEVNIEIE